MTLSVLPPPASPVPPAMPGLPAFGFPQAAPAIGPIGPDFTDDKKLLALFKTLKDEAYDNRFVFERGWWRIMLYLLGRQWIYYDVQRGQWADKRIAKWIPRPVTNKIGETLGSYRSVFQSVQLTCRARPSGNDPINVTTAETADKLEVPIRAEHDMEGVQLESDFWYITLGNVFWHPWWDKRAATGNAFIPFETCVQCQQVSGPDEIEDAGGVCPKCRTSTSFIKAAGPDGSPIGMTHSTGAGRTDVCSPFEIALPAGYREFKDVSHLIRSRWRTKQYCEANYGDLAKELRYDKMPMERSLQLLRALATTSDQSNVSLAYATTGTVSSLAEGITEFELWVKPSRDYPDGLFLRVAGEAQPKVIRLSSESTPGPLPYHTSEGNPLFPWLHSGYEHTGGRIWARSPLEPLLSKQDQINQLDSLIQLIIQRTANPVWLEPKGSEVKKFTGEPGLVVKYNPLIAAGAAKPERIPGEPVSPTLMQLRQGYITDLENLAGTSDILKGQRPPNIEAFSALQLLVERSQSRFGPALGQRGKLYRDWYKLALELERTHGPETRVYAVLSPNQSWTFENFKKANLSGEIEIIIEDGSQTPKTSLGKRAAIEQLNQLGFIDKTDPEQRYTILKTFGQTDLLPSLDNDVKSALQEQDAFERWAASPGSEPLPPPMPMPMLSDPGMSPEPPSLLAPQQETPGEGSPPPAGSPLPANEGQPSASLSSPAESPSPLPNPPPEYAEPSPFVVQYWHNDGVHNAEHRKWANSDAFRNILKDRLDLGELLTTHMQSHDLAVVKKQMLQGQLQAALMPPPQGGALAMSQSNKESGNPRDVPSGQSEAVQGRGPE